MKRQLLSFELAKKKNKKKKPANGAKETIAFTLVLPSELWQIIFFFLDEEQMMFAARCNHSFANWAMYYWEDRYRRQHPEFVNVKSALNYSWYQLAKSAYSKAFNSYLPRQQNIFKAIICNDLKLLKSSLIPADLYNFTNDGMFLRLLREQVNQKLLDYIYQEILSLSLLDDGEFFCGVKSGTALKFKSEKTATHWAVICNQIKEIKKNIAKHESQLYQKDTWGLTPLHEAAIYNRIHLIHYFRQTKDINFNVRDNQLLTPLCYAARYDRLEIAKLLLEIPGIDVNVQYAWQKSSLSIALQFKNKEIAVLILQNKDVSIYSGYYVGEVEHRPPLYLTAQYGFTSILELILQKTGMDIDFIFPLECALKNYHFDTAQVFMIAITNMKDPKPALEKIRSHPFEKQCRIDFFNWAIAEQKKETVEMLWQVFAPFRHYLCCSAALIIPMDEKLMAKFEFLLAIRLTDILAMMLGSHHVLTVINSLNVVDAKQILTNVLGCEDISFIARYIKVMTNADVLCAAVKNVKIDAIKVLLEKRLDDLQASIVSATIASSRFFQPAIVRDEENTSHISSFISHLTPH